MSIDNLKHVNAINRGAKSPSDGELMVKEVV